MNPTAELLTAAASIIAHEERWTDCMLFDETADLTKDPLCNNVTMCARGALALAAFGPAAVRGAINSDEILYGDAASTEIEREFAAHGTSAVEHLDETKEAASLLDEAASDIANRENITSDFGEDYGVVALNDVSSVPREVRYALIKEAFALAIEKANALQPV